MTLGKREIWRSLGTDSEAVACRRSHGVLAEIERLFEVARMARGAIADETLLSQPDLRSSPSQPPLPSTLRENVQSNPAYSITFGELFERFLDDPTQKWSARTRLAYETTQRLAVSIVGAETPLSQLSRAVCRELLETLRYLPKGASRAFPQFTPKEAAAHAKETGYAKTISPANANVYLNKICVVLNWGVREEFLPRNHLRGLRLADPVSRQDKRLPFAPSQLEAIFSAPLFTGCEDDQLGYARVGPHRPRGSRFWIILIGLFSGMRLNEICQMDIADVRWIDGVACFHVTERSEVGSSDKHLKTSTSERLVPIHSYLRRLGLLEFVDARGRDGHTKLFHDICPGRNGFRSVAFSKWFVLFLQRAGARSERTSFHSFRHCFRDALRKARVDREVAMSLGGWGTGAKAGLDVSDYYGRGFECSLLADEIEKIDLNQIKALHALANSTAIP